MPLYSIICCERAEGPRLEEWKGRWSAIMASHKFELLPQIGAPSMAAGFNEGFAQAKGDIVVATHADAYTMMPSFATRVEDYLKKCDAISCAGADIILDAIWKTPGLGHNYGQVLHILDEPPVVEYENPVTKVKESRPGGKLLSLAVFGVPARLIPGIVVSDGFLNIYKRKVLEKIKWDARTFDGWHLYDMDHSLRVGENFDQRVATDLYPLHCPTSKGYSDPSWEEAAVKFSRKYAVPVHYEGPAGGQGGQLFRSMPEAWATMEKLVLDTLN